MDRSTGLLQRGHWLFVEGKIEPGLLLLFERLDEEEDHHHEMGWMLRNQILHHGGKEADHVGEKSTASPCGANEVKQQARLIKQNKQK